MDPNPNPNPNPNTRQTYQVGDEGLDLLVGEGGIAAGRLQRRDQDLVGIGNNTEFAFFSVDGLAWELEGE